MPTLAPDSPRPLPAAALKTAQVAEILGMGLSTLQRLPYADLPYWTISARGDRRYDPADVLAYRDRRKADAAPR